MGMTWMQSMEARVGYGSGAEVTRNRPPWGSGVNDNVREPGMTGRDKFEASEG